jgi:hypothetical protein
VTPLLLDEHLLEHVEPLPAVRGRMVDRVEAPVEDGLLRRRRARRREPVVPLALVLERHEDLEGEVASPLPQLSVGGIQVEVHAAPSSMSR